MDKLLHYQVEQEHIFEQIKVQLDRDLSLSEIIQAALNRSCNFLGLDRLLIYQLDVPLKSEYISGTENTIDTITYEAKQENVDSALYFQQEACWGKFTQCKRKYHQGFSLVINDIDQNHNLNPCLKSLMHKFQVKAKTVTPITVRRQLWGLIIAHQCFETRQWHDLELKFLSQIADYLAVAIYRDRSYQRLQQQKTLLEQQVQNQAQQIKDALIAAEAASKSKHEFLGSMSHELRTPLTCVIGLSSTLLQWSSSKSSIPLSPEKQQQYLHLIQQSGKHLLALINNILEFSDVESGKHLLDVKQISLANIARQSLQILHETARAKKITLNSEIKLKIEQEYFFADEIRLKEILFNLLSNGIKFTPEDGQVTLRVWREKRQVIFQVEDTGIGIAPEEIPLLFEKFKQIEHFKHRTHGGTGLGLALTKKLIELHGGSIEVESSVGQGSQFTVYLPEKIFTPHLSQKPAISGKFQPNSATIMLVTEDEESATFICQLLNTIDCQVVWLMDSGMAMNQIELVKPRLIIVDRDFDSVGVNNIARAIERKSLKDSTDLVLLCDRHYPTNSNNLDEERWFSQYQVDQYLFKTMTPTQMIEKIESLIAKTSQEKQGIREK
nr:GAF domain-containing sensor histidine kinase [Waterburya agarophytonicola]